MWKIMAVLLLNILFYACSGNNKRESNMELVEADSLFLLVGSYASSREEGIKLFAFDAATGKERYVTGYTGINNPSYLVPTDDGRRVYVAGENEITDSSASALEVDYSSQKISLINTVPTRGAAPCYIVISPDGDFVLTANYHGSNISIFRLGVNGELLPPRVIDFVGNGIDKERQEKSHLHCIGFTPDRKYMLAVDLGTDCIHTFSINRQNKDKSVPFLNEDISHDFFLPSGSGPRHICFSPNKRFGYLITELSGEVIVLEYTGKNAKIVQTIQADSLNARGSADIHLSPDGKFLYASNRLQGDGIAIFKVNQENGTLEQIGYQYTEVHPRNFVISPDGSFLLVACRDSDAVQVFRRDKETGFLTNTGHKIAMSKPTCLKFIVRK